MDCEPSAVKTLEGGGGGQQKATPAQTKTTSTTIPTPHRPTQHIQLFHTTLTLTPRHPCETHTPATTRKPAPHPHKPLRLETTQICYSLPACQCRTTKHLPHCFHAQNLKPHTPWPTFSHVRGHRCTKTTDTATRPGHGPVPLSLSNHRIKVNSVAP